MPDAEERLTQTLARPGSRQAAIPRLLTDERRAERLAAELRPRLRTVVLRLFRLTFLRAEETLRPVAYMARQLYQRPSVRLAVPAAVAQQLKVMLAAILVPLLRLRQLPKAGLQPVALLRLTPPKASPYEALHASPVPCRLRPPSATLATAMVAAVAGQVLLPASAVMEVLEDIVVPSFSLMLFLPSPLGRPRPPRRTTTPSKVFVIPKLARPAVAAALL